MKMLVRTTAILVAAAAALLPARAVLADTLTSSIKNPYVGQPVTFTGTFAHPCADGAQVTFFVEGKAMSPTTMTMLDGANEQVTLTFTFKAAGTHTVGFKWSADAHTTGIPPCSGGASMSLNVRARASSAPAPKPSSSPTPTQVAEPSPEQSPSPPESPSPTASAARLTAIAKTESVKVNLGWLALGGIALLVFLAVVGPRFDRRG